MSNSQEDTKDESSAITKQRADTLAQIYEKYRIVSCNHPQESRFKRLVSKYMVRKDVESVISMIDKLDVNHVCSITGWNGFMFAIALGVDWDIFKYYIYKHVDKKYKSPHGIGYRQLLDDKRSDIPGIIQSPIKANILKTIRYPIFGELVDDLARYQDSYDSFLSSPFTSIKVNKQSYLEHSKYICDVLHVDYSHYSKAYDDRTKTISKITLVFFVDQVRRHIDKF